MTFLEKGEILPRLKRRYIAPGGDIAPLRWLYFALVIAIIQKYW